MVRTIRPEGVVLAVAMMSRPGNRGRLLLLIAGAPADDQGFHELGVRQASHFLGLASLGYTSSLFRELVAGSVIERRPGAGNRPDAWRVRADVARWAVRWPARRDPDHVRLILADGGHFVDIFPRSDPPVARGSIAERNAIFARGFIAERSGPVVNGSRPARNGGALRAEMDPRANPSSSSGAAELDPHSLNAGGGGGATHYTTELARLVWRETGRPTIGRGWSRLASFEGRLPLDRAAQALRVLPSSAGWPMVLGALDHAADSGAGAAAKPATLIASWTSGGTRYSTTGPAGPGGEWGGDIPNGVDAGSWEVAPA